MTSEELVQMSTEQKIIALGMNSDRLLQLLGELDNVILTRITGDAIKWQKVGNIKMDIKVEFDLDIQTDWLGYDPLDLDRQLNKRLLLNQAAKKKEI